MTLVTERVLFETGLKVAASAREEWLAVHCADLAVRDRIRCLLHAHDEAEVGRGFPEPVAVPEPQEPQISPYRIVDRIGEGAIGEVFLAEQTAPVVRRVAIKIIKPGMDTREVIARFETERQTLAIMSHPSIAQIFDAGTTAAGRPYFVMEYVAGIPLTSYCATHRLDLRTRLALFLEICDGVQHAHHKGIIHRDLKPTNLLVAERDGRPTPKIIDFGVSKATAPGLRPSDAHTRVGHLVGTPEYMSPEQAQVSPLDIDTRSDVYSLGVVLYELLVGSLPYRVTSQTATPMQIVNELLKSDIRPPSETLRGSAQRAAALCATSPRHLIHELRGDLDWIVLKALEKDRNRRYPSVAELAADVRRYLAREAVLAGPPTAIYRLRKFVSRRRVAVAAVAGVFIATVAFGVVMAIQARALARERDEARFQAARAEASSEFMSLMLEQVGPSGKPLKMVELLDAGLQMLDRQYQNDPRFVGRMLLQMSRRYMDLGDTARVREVLARAESIGRSLPDDEILARAQCAMAQNLTQDGGDEQAGDLMKEAKLALARVARPSLESQVDCLRAESDTLLRGTDRAAALASLSKARALLESSGATRGLAYTATLTDIGGLHFQAGDFKHALELNRLVREALERNGRGDTLAMVITTANLGQIHLRLGEVEQAEETGRQALDRLRALEKSDVPAYSLQVGYAITLTRLGRSAEAERLLADAVKQARSVGNETWALNATLQRGRALLDLGQLAASEAEFIAAENGWKRDPKGNRDRLLELNRSRAELELAAGHVTQARARIAAVLNQMGFPTNRSAPGLPAALRAAARIELSAGSPATAAAQALAAVEIATSVARDPKESADVGEALLLLGLAQRAVSGEGDARASFAQAAVALGNGLGTQHRLTRVAQSELRSAV
jgi:serine/threonine protein kinase/tetratricopeptide (TPR) repeat protein